MTIAVIQVGSGWHIGIIGKVQDDWLCKDGVFRSHYHNINSTYKSSREAIRMLKKHLKVVKSPHPSAPDYIRFETRGGND